jgi:hypothetical protein
MAKDKELKVNIELKTLETVMEKLKVKYNDFPTKPLNDTITQIQSAIYSIKQL